ncbi:sensor histidine kinase [Microbacterium indicum]|uniref:sensor histidine kinase n=1 Tax=Microbacterium indicum TaxID=358100 RepID=UPI0003FCE74D|nr:HAMP domain-containing sensor histidine kinase [Microbacterium indicum]
MGSPFDAVTRWWRRTSLRAKITGVTVGVLAAGLISAGIGSFAILRPALISSVDQSVVQLAGTDVFETVFDASSDGAGGVSVDPKNPEPRTEYIVAMYTANGSLMAVAGGERDTPSDPVFPTALTVQDAFLAQGGATTLHAADGTAYRASIAPVQVDVGGTSALLAQIVAQPLTEADAFVTTYIGVFTTMTMLTLVVGALVTRWLVTLAFRRLGQVEDTAMSIADGDIEQRMTDIEPTTEVGRLKIAINAMLDRLDESGAERDAALEKMRRFIGDASHELRTPLVSVRGYAELYRMGAIQTPEDTAGAMDRIEKEAKRMTSLVEDLLSLARLDERREVEITDVDLRVVARDAALDVRAADPARQVAVNDTTFEALTGPITLLSSSAREAMTSGAAETPDDAAEPKKRPRTTGPLPFLRRRAPKTGEQPEIAPLDFSAPAEGKEVDTPPIVRGHAEGIQQVVTNLLGNARRYSPAESPIELEVGIDPVKGMGWISVIDHGEGIPEEIRAKIFERFWRADTSRARETGGSGLGLAIVASIVERGGGTISVFETRGGGATFQVAFPLAAQTA